jgi:hypothetical protein
MEAYYKSNLDFINRLRRLRGQSPLHEVDLAPGERVLVGPDEVPARFVEYGKQRRIVVKREDGRLLTVDKNQLTRFSEI